MAKGRGVGMMDRSRVPNGALGFRERRPERILRSIISAVALVALSSGAFAHLEAVRIEAIFPTAGRSGIQLQIFGSDSGGRITGAKVELEMRGPGVNETVPFTETQPGIYRVDRGFEAGNYNFKVLDKTFDYETLEKAIDNVALPRPNGQDAMIWLWPATPLRPPQAAPTSPLVIGLIALPVAIAALVGVAAFVVSRRSRRQNTGAETADAS